MLTVTKPDCYTEDEWEDYYKHWSVSVWHPDRHDALISICNDCDIPYQMSQVMLGKCNPIDPNNTPYARVERGEPETVGTDEEEEQEVREKSRLAVQRHRERKRAALASETNG